MDIGRRTSVTAKVREKTKVVKKTNEKNSHAGGRDGMKVSALP